MTEPASLTASQLRVLTFMREEGSGWVTLTVLDQSRILEDDDVLTIPSLIERGFLAHRPEWQLVSLTPAGQVFADEAACR